MGFNSLGEWNSSGNCFSPSLDMWSEGKKLEMKQTEFVLKSADKSAFTALYDWCEQSSLHFQPPKVPQTFWCELSSPYLQPQTVSQTVRAQQLEIKTCWRNRISSKLPISVPLSFMFIKPWIWYNQFNIFFWKEIEWWTSHYSHLF